MHPLEESLRGGLGAAPPVARVFCEPDLLVREVKIPRNGQPFFLGLALQSRDTDLRYFT